MYVIFIYMYTYIHTLYVYVYVYAASYGASMMALLLKLCAHPGHLPFGEQYPSRTIAVTLSCAF